MSTYDSKGHHIMPPRQVGVGTGPPTHFNPQNPTSKFPRWLGKGGRYKCTCSVDFGPEGTLCPTYIYSSPKPRPPNG